MGFLDGLRVLDCTDERGLVAGRLLADFGADVVQVEPPGGSPARQVPPTRRRESLFWSTYSAGKSSLVLDLTERSGRDHLLGQVASADFFIESGDHGDFERLGLGWQALREVNPALVYVSISAFGRTGPKASWPATDLTVWAAGGPLAYNLDETGPPLRISVPQAFLHASADAAGGALLAHQARLRTGRGQWVDVSAQASLGLCTLAAALIAVTGDREPDWIPRPGRGVTIDQSGSGSRTRRSKWPVRDGYVELHLAMGPAVGAFTNNFFAWMADEGGLDDAVMAAWDWRELPRRLASGEIGEADIDLARARVGAFLAAKSKAEVTAAALERKLLSVGVADVSDLATSEHFRQRGFLRELTGCGSCACTAPGPVARITAPAYRWDGPSPVTRGATSAPGGGGGPPLAGLKVADLSWVVAGPVIGRALADFGATVVRVESATKVETARHMPPFYGGRPGVESSALYINCNAGKLGLALDLSTGPGREIVRRLAAWADVVVESFTPGQMDRWGLGYETLAAANPGLVMVSSSLMGQTGPLSRLAGFGNIGAAMSGFQYLAGWPDRPPLGPFGPYTDYIGPRLALVALLAALEHRERTGAGCWLDLAQAECGAWFLAPQIAAYLATGEVAERAGNRDPRFAPHGVFQCRPSTAGADHVAIVARDLADFQALMELAGRPDLGQDPRLTTLEGRKGAEDALEEALAGWTATLRAEEAEARCVAAGVPAHRASKSADFVADVQLAHRGHLVTLDHPLHGQVVVEGPRYQLSETPGQVTRAAPTIGQDNEEVLQMLGLDRGEIARLAEEGVLR